MKSKQRFFDGTVLKKDLTRFAPAWALYLIGGVMIAVSAMSNEFSWAGNGLGSRQVVNALNDCVGSFGMLNMVYAILVAQLLFGDMFNSKLCNALHAMPLRREGWFITHLVSGLAFSLVPNLVISLSIMPFAGEYWYATLLWLLGMQMHYLFFFGLAVFSMFCTGSRFAAVTVYGILNFLSLLVAWFAFTMYYPLLYGLTMDDYQGYVYFCPVVQLLENPDYFSVLHLGTCPCKLLGDTSYTLMDNGILHKTAWGGMGSSWGYLGILAAIGAVLLVLALLLYRRRSLESAGSFVAFRPMKPLFRIIFTLGAGGVCQFFATWLMGESDAVGYLFLTIGLILGFFVSQMFIERTVRVFRRKSFLQLAIFAVAFSLSLLLTWLDPIGITRYIPKADQVEKVYVVGDNISYETIQVWEKNDRPYTGYTSTEPQSIEKARQVHQLLIDEGRGKYYNTVTVCYVLKNGQVVLRQYAPYNDSKADTAVQELLRTPEAATGYSSLEALKAAVTNIHLNGSDLNPTLKDSFLEALWQDAQAGSFSQNESWHYQNHDCEKPLLSFMLYYENGYGNTFYLYRCCTNLQNWVGRNATPADSLLSTLSLEDLMNQVDYISSDIVSFDSPNGDLLYDLLYCMKADMAYGTAVSCYSATVEQLEDWNTVAVAIRSGSTGHEKLLVSPESKTWNYLLEHADKIVPPELPPE